MPQPLFIETLPGPLNGFNGVAAVVAAVIAGTKDWKSLTWEVVTAAVGVGAFTLPRMIGKWGILVYLCLMTFISWVSYRACTWWTVHKKNWNRVAAKDPSMVPIDTYESWGTALYGNCGRNMLLAGQLGYYTMILVVFLNLMDSQLVLLMKHPWLAGNFGLPSLRDNNYTEITMADIPATFASDGSIYLSVNPNVNKPEVYGRPVAFKKDAVFYDHFTSFAYPADHEAAEAQNLVNYTDSIQRFEVDKFQVGCMSNKDDKQTWKRQDDVAKCSAEKDVFAAARLTVEKRVEPYFIKLADMKAEKGPQTKLRTQSALYIAVVLQGLALIFQYVPNVNKMLGYLGVAGVMGSWLLIGVQMVRLAVEGGGANTEVDQFKFMPTSMIEDRSALENIQQLFVLAGSCMGAWGLMGLVPDFSRALRDPGELNLALAVGHLICYSVYLIPIALYMLCGKFGDAVTLIPADLKSSTTDLVLSFAFRIFVIGNMIASYALTGQCPVLPVENLIGSAVGGRGAGTSAGPKVQPMVRWLVRLAFTVGALVIKINVGGTFDMVFSLVGCMFVPFATVIFPWLFHLKIKSVFEEKGEALEFERAWKFFSCPKFYREKVEDAVMWLAFAIAVASVFFGVWGAWVQLSELNELGGLVLGGASGTELRSFEVFRTAVPTF